jgi:mannose-1-phosphate guanylyltransferase
MMKDNYYAMIMAGGGGTRLWPLSRRARPKQSLRLFGDDTLFQTAVKRITPVFKRENINILTVADQARILETQVEWLKPENFLLEPAPRGTASVIGLAAMVLREQGEEGVMACLTADHYIENEELFRSLLLAAYDAATEGHLVTLGIRPDYADTGYGYIQQGKSAGRYHDFEALKALQFREKPDQETAEAYLSSGDYVWNSGMFVWRVDRILEEIERQMPALYSALERIREAWDSPERETILSQSWMDLESVTIDYGIMEGARDVVVIPAQGLGWLDVGDWSRLFDIQSKNEDGNVVLADKTILEAVTGTLILQEGSGESDRLIAALGVEDLIIIDVGDVLLICSRDRAGDVKRLVDDLRDKGDVKYL